MSQAAEELSLRAIAVEAGAGGAVAAEDAEFFAQGGAGAVEGDAGGVGRQAEGRGDGGDGLGAELGEADEGGLRGRERGDERVEAGAEVAGGFGGIDEGGGVGGVKVFAGGGGLAGADVVHEGVAQELVEPRDETLVVAEGGGGGEGFGEAVLEHVLGVGVVAAEAGGEETEEGLAAGEEDGEEVGGIFNHGSHG